MSTKLRMNRINCIESLNEELLASCSKLKTLNMTDCCLRDTTYNIDFLASLPKLTELNITWIEGLMSFDIFQELKQLKSLELHGSASIDANHKRLILTQNDFKRLATMKKLETLRLNGFNMKLIDPNMLKAFKNLTSWANFRLPC